MYLNNAPTCLTRVIGDECDVQVTRMQEVMGKITGALHSVPEPHRQYIANALLNLAVARMMREEGSERTSGILARLGEYVGTGQAAPPPERAVDLTNLNS
jgi:hypothetical protein